MIVALDLDDTLYDERTFVESGFRAVAAHLQATRDLPAATSLSVLLESLDRSPRGQQIDDLLEHWGMRSKTLVAELVGVYRHHRPAIQLPEMSQTALNDLRAAGHRLYLVTDGHKGVQANKVAALGLADRFERCYLTNRYGIAHNKPSCRVFELMLRRERAQAAELVYIGDDPAKDFVGVRTLGGHTIRVRTGRHAAVEPKPGFEPDYEIENLLSAANVIERIAGKGGSTVPPRR